MCPCVFVVPEATQEASRGPLKGTVSAQKALQGSKTETKELLGGAEEKNEGSLICPSGKSFLFTKRKQNKIQLVARPVSPRSGELWSRPSSGEGLPS